MKRPLLIVIALAPITLAVGYWLLASDLPSPTALTRLASPDATKIYDRRGRLLFEVLDPRAGRRTRVPVSQLPSHVTNAVIAVEDVGFYGNSGIDLRGVSRAALQLVRERRIVSGGSTITQQLARQVLLPEAQRRERSFLRKAREMVLAVRITRGYSKDQILEMYLNEVYFGQLAYGIEAACQTYFGKPARQLDLAEAALLAGLIQSPAVYNPLVDLGTARARQRIVLKLMVRAEFITADEARLAGAEPLHLTGGGVPLEAPHFVSYVRNLMEARYGPEAVNNGGLHIITALDLDLQRRAEAIVGRRMADLSAHQPGRPDYHASDAALVALDVASGDILAMVGSADYFDPDIDGAVNVALARRQPGSAIKPITYATAFDTDRWGLPGPDRTAPPGRPPLPFTPATVVSDVPTTFLTRENEPYRPRNYDRLWHGPIPLRQALASSSNMAAVKVLDGIGVDAMIDTAEALGITTLADRDRYGLALTLGGGEVTLLELTATYAGFAAAGHRVTPRAVLAVVDSERFAAAGGDIASLVIHGKPSPGPRPVSAQVAYLITDILSDDEARLPAFGEHSVLELDRPAAAKTGTTTDFRDNWTVGYTPDLATGVWLGNADNSPMQYISGITGAGPIWHEFMTEAHRARPARSFIRPSGLVRAEVCATSGLVATSDCPRRRLELFIAGTEPTELDTSYRRLALDASTGLLWADGCRGPRIERTFRFLPADAAAWGRSAGIPEPPAEDCRGGRVIAAPAVDGATAQSISLERLTGAGLVITQPAPNATFAISPQLPSAFQRIELVARTVNRETLATVVLLVDEQPVATRRGPPYRADWPLAAGTHRLQAVGTDHSGHRIASEIIRFTVLEGETERHENQ